MSEALHSLPPERYRGQRIALLAHVPPWARRILMVGTDKGRVGHLLKKRQPTEIHGIEQDAHDAALAAQLLDSVLEDDPACVTLPFELGSFEAVLVLDPPSCDALARTLRQVSRLLSGTGRVLVLCHNAGFWRGAPSGALLPGEIEAQARDAGYHVHLQDASSDPEYAPAPDHAERPDWADLLFTLTLPGYDVLAHARALRASGRPDWAYRVYQEIPETERDDEDQAIVVQTEMLGCLVEWGTRGLLDAPDRLYFQAVQLFYGIVRRRPCQEEAYGYAADLWQLMGAPEMGARLLRSLHHAAPSPKLEQRIKKLPHGRLRRDERTPPAWAPGERAPRVLFVLHPRPHYGLDVLFDGLSSVLGAQDVVDFPSKPTLHGAIDPILSNYPCSFDLPDHAFSLDRVLDELRAGRFDFILYGDCERGLPRKTARVIGEAAGDTPLFLVDQRDEFFDCRQETLEYLGVRECAGYFKREMLACLDYGPDAMPMPFAYPDGRIPESVDEEREHLFFWAGHRNFSLRRLYLEQLERMLGERFDATYTPAAYAARLRSSRVGLNCYGMGFDTVRYWELPAHGCLLLSERLPILVPYDFRDGESALLFDDAAELDRKLTYLRRYPELVAGIAKSGRAHLLAHHTGTARARHLLGWVKQMLGT
jgi:hypothetical protein